MYAYFLTEPGKKALSKANNLSFLKKQIYFRIFDALKEIKKPLKLAILESEYLNNPEQDVYYDLEIDRGTDVAEQFIDRQNTLELCDLLIREVKRLPKVRQGDFVCYKWEGLSQMCDLLRLDPIILVDKIKSHLSPRQIVQIFNQCPHHIERAQKVFYPEISDSRKLIQKENNYRRNAIRGLEDLAEHIQRLES